MSVRGAYHGCTHIAESLDTGERIESSSTDARLPDPGVAHLLRETHPTLRVESRVFPAYQTRGELVSATMESPQAILLAVCVSHLGCIVKAWLTMQTAATLAFVDWLTTLVVGLEVDHGAGGGAGKAKVVLMGHSCVPHRSLLRMLTSG